MEERKFARELLADGLLRSIHSTEEKYQRLERSVYDAKKLPPDQYEIVMTVIKRGCYDPANLTLYPALKEDLEPVLTDTAEDPVILQEV